MGYVRIKIQKVVSRDGLQSWEYRMLEKAKCWNKYCLGLCGEHELRAVHVVKEGNENNLFLQRSARTALRPLLI